ncbi:hypothetical protein HHK36_015140 [Tetracentron sinense]|uniref:26S proteasome complex subunit SEM1 n=1 Tax=Tetracentron sinense TaxID=13715 RepID=A0A834Z2I8_TETSI|nr:hypothetical protein HHK36_015140 [Tetracentron sinense]
MKLLALEIYVKQMVGRFLRAREMATEPKVVTEDAKIDLFEDDDEFEEFETEEWDDKEEGKEATQQWEDDWDDDDVNDDFSLQLRRELENTEKS